MKQGKEKIPFLREVALTQYVAKFQQVTCQPLPLHTSDPLQGHWGPLLILPVPPLHLMDSILQNIFLLPPGSFSQ